jgi:NAD(P)-dependent dehydrogenase (short-subunit alcohol dehydrogenase family)
VPGQKGKTAIVTGSNAGLGFLAAKALADRGAHVVLAVRDLDKGAAAVERIKQDVPHADLAIQKLDTSSLDSTRRAAADLKAGYEHIDLLINNAGVMAIPEARSVDGYEMQLATNFLGPFVLTGELLDILRATPGSRIVSLSSTAHKFGRINFKDLNSALRYNNMMAYNQSKLADLMFALALQRRLDAAGEKNTISVCAHPGLADTGLFQAIPGFRKLISVLVQPPEMGVLPILRAATDPAVHGGEYYGPHSLLETKSYPGRARMTRTARNRHTQRRLWQEAERLTGERYSL